MPTLSRMEVRLAALAKHRRALYVLMQNMEKLNLEYMALVGKSLPKRPPKIRAGNDAAKRIRFKAQQRVDYDEETDEELEQMLSKLTPEALEAYKEEMAGLAKESEEDVDLMEKEGTEGLKKLGLKIAAAVATTGTAGFALSQLLENKQVLRHVVKASQYSICRWCKIAVTFGQLDEIRRKHGQQQRATTNFLHRGCRNHLGWVDPQFCDGERGKEIREIDAQIAKGSSLDEKLDSKREALIKKTMDQYQSFREAFQDERSDAWKTMGVVLRVEVDKKGVSKSADAAVTLMSEVLQNTGYVQTESDREELEKNPMLFVAKAFSTIELMRELFIKTTKLQRLDQVDLKTLHEVFKEQVQIQDAPREEAAKIVKINGQSFSLKKISEITAKEVREMKRQEIAVYKEELKKQKEEEENGRKEREKEARQLEERIKVIQAERDKYEHKQVEAAAQALADMQIADAQRKSAAEESQKLMKQMEEEYKAKLQKAETAQKMLQSQIEKKESDDALNDEITKTKELQETLQKMKDAEDARTKAARERETLRAEIEANITQKAREWLNDQTNEQKQQAEASLDVLTKQLEEQTAKAKESNKAAQKLRQDLDKALQEKRVIEAKRQQQELKHAIQEARQLPVQKAPASTNLEKLAQTASRRGSDGVRTWLRVLQKELKQVASLQADGQYVLNRGQEIPDIPPPNSWHLLPDYKTPDLKWKNLLILLNANNTYDLQRPKLLTQSPVNVAFQKYADANTGHGLWY